MERAINDYREILRGELLRRCRRNPRYSLRAFARDLSLAPSRVSEILSGKSGLSPERAHAVARALGLDSDEHAWFCRLVESRHARSRLRRERADRLVKRNLGDRRVRQLKMDTFEAIAHWHYYAILELISLPGAKTDAISLGRRLAMAPREVEDAIERLLRLGLIERRRKKLRVAASFTRSPSEIPSSAIREFHREVLEKAALALESRPLAARDHSAIILSISADRMAKAKRMLRQFRRRFTRVMQEGDAKDAVYCLSLQFFDLLEGELS